MSDHLPECFYRRGTGESVVINPVCICDRLRACEVRVLAGEQVSVAIRAAHDLGRDKGVQAARDAVAALPDWSTFSEGLIYRDEALAAIDNLITKNSGENYG